MCLRLRDLSVVLTSNEVCRNCACAFLRAKIGPFCWASVEYGLAPESKFPACIDDFTSAYVSLADAELSQEFGYDVNRMSIMGVSAGALVAAHAALRLDTGYKPPLAFLHLVQT